MFCCARLEGETSAITYHSHASTVETRKASELDVESKTSTYMRECIDTAGAMPDGIKNTGITILNKPYPQQTQGARREEGS